MPRCMPQAPIYFHLPDGSRYLRFKRVTSMDSTSSPRCNAPRGSCNTAEHLLVNQSLPAELEGKGVQIILGPCQRTGASAPLLSIYMYDPDENLIELSNIK